MERRLILAPQHFYYFVKEFGLIEPKELEPLVRARFVVGRRDGPSLPAHPALQKDLTKQLCPPPKAMAAK